MRLEHSYEGWDEGQWMKGNLHAHTTRSDGERGMQAVIDDYAGRGYGFLMISDHDMLTAEKEYKEVNARGMILVGGNEITANGPHMLHVGATRLVAPDADRQRAIEEANKSGGMVVVNHPNWEARFDHCSIENLKQWQGYVGMEVFNGVIRRLDGSPYATNKWDMLLSAGRKVWAFADDDSHAAKGDVGLGWNVALVRDKSADGVIEALRKGRFYASTGVEISRIEVKGMKVRIETKNAERIVALQQVGQRFAQVDARVMEVEVPSGAKYVRFECWGKGEEFAWTQAMWVVG